MCGVSRQHHSPTPQATVCVSTCNLRSESCRTTARLFAQPLAGRLDVVANPRSIHLRIVPREPHKPYHRRGLKHHTICTNVQLLEIGIEACEFGLSLCLSYPGWSGGTYAISRTVHPNLINPSHAKRKSMEFGHSSATVFPDEVFACNDFNRACPIAIDPWRRSSNAKEQIRSQSRKHSVLYFIEKTY